MPLKKGSSKKAMAYNFSELKKDNMKKGKEKGQGGKKRSQKQIVAIVMSMAGKSKKRND